jgi:putative ABC transport system permease protein
MENTLEIIPLTGLAVAFIPVALVVVLLFRWSLDASTAIYAVFRMLIQLLLIGYALNWIFAGESAVIVMLLLAIMLMAASRIALRPLEQRTGKSFVAVLLAISLGGGGTLALITAGVLQIDPWYAPRQIIPLAGMIFAGSMNAVSLAAERFAAELERDAGLAAARNSAYQAALIPLVNSLFAVGLVSLPGMMTGQILSGVEPLVAARYQIMVMCMMFGAAGISAAIYLALLIRQSETPLAHSDED